MARVHDSIFDNFSEEALEALDFARCQRADGSFYGTSGQCRKGKEAGAKPAEAPKGDRMSVLKERIAAAKASGDKKKLKGLRHELQGMQRSAKVEAEAKRTGRTFDDVARERAARADAKIKARIAARYPQMFANKPGAAKGGAMADAKAGEREIARGEKFIGRARVAMKRLSNERNVAQMRLQIGRVNQIDEAMKRLRKKAEQVGGRLDELTGTKGQGKYYVS